MEQDFTASEEVEVVYLADEDEIEALHDFFDEESDSMNVQSEIVDLSKVTFSNHKGSVFSSALGRNGTIAATGGEDNMAYTWMVETGEIFFECTGHKDSVTEVLFNHDDQYLATGDMTGLIQVWSVDEKKLVWCFELEEMEWLLWHPLTNVLFCGIKSGDIYLWQIPLGNCKILPSDGASSTCAKLLPDGKRLISGYDDGKIKLWDIKSASVEWQNSDPSKNGITSININKTGSLGVIAPTGQMLKIQDGHVLASLLLTNQENSIEAAVFDSLGLVATGSLSGHLCVWNVGRYNLRHEAKIESSVTVMKWIGQTDKLLIGSANGIVYICDGKLGTLVETLTGHTDTILSLSVFQSSTTTTVLTTSDDGTAKIFLL